MYIFKKACNFVRKKALYILTEFLIKMCIYEMYNKVWLGKQLAILHFFSSQWAKTRGCFVPLVLILI
jgi:hypothetical protein